MIQSSSTRLTYLDSLRGIVSLSVVIYHWMFAFPEEHRMMPERTSRLWAMIFNGADAVSFFFVLSGLVLSYKYLQGSYVNKRIDYKSFAIARFYRLYPAYWFCLLFYYLHTVWGTKIKVFLSLSDLLAEASLLRNFAPLYGAGWTLNIEMVLSLVMPFLILLIRYDEKLFRIFIVLSLLFSSFFSQFLFHFSLGIFISYHFKSIQNFDFKNSSIYPYRWLISILVMAAYSIRHIYELYPFEKALNWLNRICGFTFFQVTAIASACVIVFAIQNRKAQQILENKLFTFLGEISYGMYLVHWFWLFYILKPKFEYIQNTFQTNNFYTGIIIGVMLLFLTITSSFLIYRFIELPFIEKGRKRVASLKVA
ncbi:MAG: acyltransferase [Saprospiraceae bacterium]|nr:acyltransferase [Saprospiraceae bacterium]